MTAALAFVQVGDVSTIFRQLKAGAPERMNEFMEYFDVNYVNGLLA